MVRWPNIGLRSGFKSSVTNIQVKFKEFRLMRLQNFQGKDPPRAQARARARVSGEGSGLAMTSDRAFSVLSQLMCARPAALRNFFQIKS
jgi:hypothetical protein